MGRDLEEVRYVGKRILGYGSHSIVKYQQSVDVGDTIGDNRGRAPLGLDCFLNRGNSQLVLSTATESHRTSMSGASSLSSVVSGLVRAQMGSSVPNNVQEDEVDRYVQELILKEAKQKAERYGSLGIQAYLPP